MSTSMQEARGRDCPNCGRNVVELKKVKKIECCIYCEDEVKEDLEVIRDNFFDTECDSCGRQVAGMMLFFNEYKGRDLDLCYPCYETYAQKEIQATKEMYKKQK